MSHFYLTLPSNSSMQSHDGNTAAKFTTCLPSAIDLSGEWEVALSEIIYPCKFDYVKDECVITVRNGFRRRRSYRLEKKIYDAPTNIIQDLNVIDHGNSYRLS